MKKYIKEHGPRFEQELVDWLKIPSISTLPSHRPEVIRCAELLKTYLIRAGAQEARLIETKGNPLVYAERFVHKTLPTILVYGHYDVQPVDPLSLWTTPPFEPKIKEGKIYARGASDDKGQVFAHIKALEYMHAEGSVPCNVKFLIEGEEEVGSPSLYAFLEKREHAEMLKADVVLVSDTSIQSEEQPSLPLSLRGMASLRVEVQGARRDLHSGVYGGAVANPIQVLTSMLARLKNERQEITIPRFYDRVKELSRKERDRLNAGFDLEGYKKAIGIPAIHGEEGYTTLERVGIRPALDINGIHGGYTGEGVKTVLPARAYATLSMRLVHGQDPVKIAESCKAYLRSLAPKGVEVEVTLHAGKSRAFSVCPDSLGIKAAYGAFEEVWGREPVLVYEGGSIPILSKLQQTLSKDVVLMGFGLDTDNIHSPDEHFVLNNLYLGMESIVRFCQKFTKSYMGN